jgi:hypothetical protein
MVSEVDDEELEELIEDAMTETPSKIPSPYPVAGTKASIKLSETQIYHLKENTDALEELQETNESLAETIEEHKAASRRSSRASIALTVALLLLAGIQLLVRLGIL